MYRLIINLNDGSKIDNKYNSEEIATNLYAMALFKKLATYAVIIDTTDNTKLFEFKA